MAELYTIDEVQQYLRSVVEGAGGAKKWAKKHRIHMDHALHMLSNGSAATLPDVLDVLGFEKITLYRPKVK